MFYHTRRAFRLTCEQATWDSPLRSGDPSYAPFQTAMKRFLDSREVKVLKQSKEYHKHFDKRAKDEFRTQHALKEASDLDIGQDPALKLMPFQVHIPDSISSIKLMTHA